MPPKRMFDPAGTPEGKQKLKDIKDKKPHKEPGPGPGMTTPVTNRPPLVRVELPGYLEEAKAKFIGLLKDPKADKKKRQDAGVAFKKARDKYEQELVNV